MQHSHNAVQWVARTAMGIALIIVAQLLGKVFPAGAVIVGPFSVNQLVTGSLVNCVLFVFTAVGGLWSGVTMGIVSAMLAQFIGIGPAVSAVSPVVALGNALLCVVFALMLGRERSYGARQWAAMAISAVYKVRLPLDMRPAPARRPLRRQAPAGADAQHHVLLAPGLHRPHRRHAREPRDTEALEDEKVKNGPAGLEPPQ